MHRLKRMAIAIILLAAACVSSSALAATAKPQKTATPKAPASLTGLGVIGKIEIPGTRIKYNIVVAVDNVYYMDKDENGKKDANGAIFMDYRNRDATRRKNIILYGHNMKSGAMFADLHKIKTKEGLAKYSLIKLTLYKRVYEYEIVRMIQADISKDNYTRTQFNSNAEYVAFLDKIMTHKALAQAGTLTDKDELLSLVTCVKGAFNDRLIAYAKRVKDLGPEK